MLCIQNNYVSSFIHGQTVCYSRLGTSASDLYYDGTPYYSESRTRIAATYIDTVQHGQYNENQ